jgi:tartrate-resistant acid phosphatase type 5
MKTIQPILFALLLTACSDTVERAATTCPTGQEINPISGVCVGPTTSTNNRVVLDVGTDSSSTEDVGPIASDVGVEPDVSNPLVDMGVIDTDMGKPVENLIRFVAIGDQGTGSATQRKIGAMMGTVCQSLGGCDFGLLLGDNVYGSGVSSIDDALWLSHFEEPYGGLPFSFYAVLGNHDLGGDGLGLDLDQNKATYQVDYGQINSQWKMPARYYDFSSGPAHFVALDTTAIFFGTDSNQRQDVDAMIARAGSRWKIAFGHHPYYSNGPHGNAGKYDNVPFIPIANGENIRSFIDAEICGKVDFYICGHDHSRQDLVPTCQGTQFIVSGAGAKTTELGGSNPTHYESDVEGFLLVEATDTRFTIRFYDENGVMNHERTVTR